MAYPVMPLGFLGSQGDNDTYKIERSLRFNSADLAYLNRTPASAGNRKTWTWSGWVKRSRLVDSTFFSAYIGSGTVDTTYFGAQFYLDQIRIANYSTVYRITNQLFRDVSSWYHIVFSIDTTNATASERVKLYVNGSEITSFSTSNNPTLNQDLAVNQNYQHTIGRQAGFVDYMDGYLTEINFIDGQALTPSSFGETDAITGRWKAKAYSGTYGTNGFYLKFADNSGTTSTTLGKDSSPNGNNWTPNNFSVTAGAGNDSLVDSPTNYGTDSGVGGEVRGNYCTLNPLFASTTGATLANGNLNYIGSNTVNSNCHGTIAVTSGKWYFEVIINSISSTGNQFGIISPMKSGGTIYTYASGGGITGIASGSSYTTNDILGCAFNIDGGTVQFFKNGVSQGTITGLSLSGIETGFGIFNGATTTWSADVNFGQRPFAYTAPTGFKALCTTNLPTPTIRKPSSYMDVVTFTANNGSGTISSLGFEPDIAWIKDRDASGNHFLHDSIRGFGTYLSSNLTNAEASGGGITSRTSNGFNYSIGNTNRWVAWSWDEAPIAGMDIVSYTGTGVARTIAHNLGVAPKMIIVKDRDFGSANWCVYHTSSGAGNYLILNSTAANTASTVVWNNTAPTSSEFSLGAFVGSNANGDRHIAYLFAEVEGFSKFGSFTGNGSSDGPFVWCGFRPRFVLWKNSDNATSNWDIWDSGRNQSNVVDKYLDANLSNAEGTFSQMDFVSNGFKLRGSTNSGQTIIFAAFAESPFKYARAR